MGVPEHAVSPTAEAGSVLTVAHGLTAMQENTQIARRTIPIQ